MDKPLLFCKRELPVLEWIPPTSDVGSVQVYRATDNISEALGSRTLLGTFPVTGSGNTFRDTASGSQFNIYRIRFLSSVGSSPLSDYVSPIFGNTLAYINDVKLASKISANSDIGSDEIFQSIQDATNWVFREYGDPVMKTIITIMNDGDDDPKVYDFTGDHGPVYQVRLVTVGTGEEYLVSGSSYEVDFNEGQIKFQSAFASAHEGELVRMEWIPQCVNDLVKYKAALDLIEMGMVIDGPDVINTRVEKLKRNVEEIRESMRPKGVYAAKQVIDPLFFDSDGNVSIGGTFVGQKIAKRSLRFNNTQS